MRKLLTIGQKQVNPERIVKVGLATPGGNEAPLPPDSISQPVGKMAIARANEAVRDLPKRERVFKVGMAGERAGVATGRKQPSMMPAETTAVLPGEHRYAYQLEKNDVVLNLGTPTPEHGRWFRIIETPVHTKIEGKVVNVELQMLTEPGYRATMHLKGNAAVKIVRDKENPYG